MGPVGECERPIRLNRRTIDTRTGELSDRLFHKRCGSRRKSECETCSKLFRDDAIAIIRSGLRDENGKQRIATWVTLTAPGADVFGKVHSQRLQSGRARKCTCGETHQDGDPRIGTPVDPERYRYDLAADFNSNASRLATVTFQKLGRLLGRKLRVVRVMEFQSRGLIHVHALVLGTVTARSLETVVRGGENLRTGRRIAPASSGGWSWGPQCRADVILPDSDRRLGYYMAKVVGYAVKCAGDDIEDGSDHARRMKRAGERSTSCNHTRAWCRCGDPFFSSRVFVVSSAGEVHSTQKLRYVQSPPSPYACRKHRNAGRGWGFRGHVLTTSRSWGLSFADVRAKRQSYRRSGEKTRPEHLVVKWTVLGREYIPNEGMLISASFST